MMAGARIESGEEKEHPMDFVLWKGTKPGEPQWESPWGPGRPGWHIECSAMSLKYLGEQIDIHGGGQDLIFPHHENEIAQSESSTGKKPFVKYWLHNGLLQLGTEKMSKSLGNLITIKDALQKYSSDDLRIFFLSGHYRSPITYSTEIVEGAGRGAERLRQAAFAEAKEGAREGNLPVETYKQRFIEAMDDDFNSAQAIAVMFDLVRDINRSIEAGASAVAGQQLLKELADVIGLTLKAPDKSLAKLRGEKLDRLIELITDISGKKPELTLDAEGYINLAKGIRDALRKDKNFQKADEIRVKLEQIGIVLEDTPKGTVWKGKG
jgi:cysteinyl-tRNA synthetase